MTGEGDHLSVFDPTRTFSTYEGSDTHSIASSEEDQWGMQIGGYNELHPSFPPPPVALLIPNEDRLIGAKTLGGQELEAILESGFDDMPEIPGPTAAYASRHRSNDSTVQPMNSNVGYAPLAMGSRNRPGGDGYGAVPILSDIGSPTSPNSGASSGFAPEWTHAKRRSGGKEIYGPLGPLDPGGGRI
jgi:chitin synthase